MMSCALRPAEDDLDWKGMMSEPDQARKHSIAEWLLHRGPGVVFLRVFAQGFRILTGRPLYRYSRITPQVYVGGQHRARGWKSMQAHGITAMVNLRREWDDVTKGVAPARYLHLPTHDNMPPSLDDLCEGVRFITEEVRRGGVVYIHCGAGVGRAPTLAAAYFVSTGMTPDQAWQAIRAIRPFIWPLRGQIKQVERFAEIFPASRSSD